MLKSLKCCTTPVNFAILQSKIFCSTQWSFCLSELIKERRYFVNQQLLLLGLKKSPEQQQQQKVERLERIKIFTFLCPSDAPGKNFMKVNPIFEFNR